MSGEPGAEISVNSWRRKAFLVIGTSFGLGYAPIAPGTFGALPAVAIYVAIVLLVPTPVHFWLIGLALLIVCVATVAMSPWAEKHFGKKDPGNFVPDEVAGYLMTVWLLTFPLYPYPPAHLGLTVLWTFLVTRGVDIIKPPPCRQLEHLPKGWGILADDLFASVYAAILLHIGIALFPWIMGAVA